MSKHQLRHKPPGGFICPECGERFVTDAERLLHKEDIHKVSAKEANNIKQVSILLIRMVQFQIFKCMICNEKCDSENAFVDHINQLHDGRDREYVTCDDCGAQFRQKNQLKFVIVFFLIQKFGLHHLYHCFLRCASFEIGYIVGRGAELCVVLNAINVMQSSCHQTR